MLEDKDIQKLIEVFATKEDIKDLKQDIAGLREQIQALTVAVDRLVKAVENLRQEYFAIKSQVDRHEKWLHQIAEKLGIKLEY